MSKVTFRVNVRPLKARMNEIKATVKSTVEQVTMEQLAYVQNDAMDIIYSYPKSVWYKRTGNLGRNYIIEDYGGWSGSKYYATLSNRTDYFNFVERGTGIYHPNGRQTRWVFKTSDGQYHWTKGMQGRYSMSKAFSEVRDSLVPYLEYRINHALK